MGQQEQHAIDSVVTWWRGQYQIVDDTRGGVTVRSVVAMEGAQWEKYDPMSDGSPPEIQPKDRSEHHSTPHGHLASIDVRNDEELLGFVNRWGLLGLWKSPDYRDPSRNIKIPGAEIPAIGEFGREPKEGEADRRFSLWYLPPGINQDDPTHTALVQTRFDIYKHLYREPLDQVALAAAVYQDFANDLEAMPGTVTMSTVSASYWLSECSPVMVPTNGAPPWRLAWRAPSLLHAIYLLTALEHTSGRGFRRCARDNCRRLFIPSGVRSEFCSTACRMAHKQAMYRVRKQARERFKAGETVESLAKEYGQSKDQISEWVGLNKEA